ncbi:MAG: hypothetical protein AAF938_08090 [Myxococcota bacterium]
MVRHRFVQHFQAEADAVTGRETRTVDGESQPAVSQPLPLKARGGRLRVAKRLLARGLRWSGGLLMLGPLFWLAYALVGAPFGGPVVVAFVMTAVAFFLFLNLYIIVAGSLWMSEAGKPRRAAPFFELGVKAAVSGEATRVTGTLRAIEASKAGDVLWTDAWFANVRLSEGTDWVVERPHAPPLVIELGAAPIVLSDRSEAINARDLSANGAAPLGESANEAGRAVRLRSGDSVTVYFTGAAPEPVSLDSLQLHSRTRAFHRESAAYRGAAARGERVRCTPDARVAVFRDAPLA